MRTTTEPDVLRELEKAHKKLKKLSDTITPFLLRKEELRLRELRQMHTAASGLASRLERAITDMEDCFSNGTQGAQS